MADETVRGPGLGEGPPPDRRCTFHRAHGPICGNPEDHPAHSREDERKRPGTHIWRHNPKDAHRLGPIGSQRAGGEWKFETPPEDPQDYPGWGVSEAEAFQPAEGEVERVAEALAQMHLFDVEVEPQMSYEVVSPFGPVQRFDIVAASSADAAEEAVRRWRENIRPNVSVNVRSPILIERLSNNVVQTQDAPRGDSWWRRIFR